jgi:hypothetical protein
LGLNREPIMRLRLIATLLAATSVSPALAGPITTSFGSQNYTVQGLVGVGRMSASLKDQFGETFGSMSGLSADQSAWTRTSTGYSGRLIGLPDRGYNVAGTTDYDARLNYIDFDFRPAPLGSTGNDQNQLNLILTKSVKLFEQTSTGGQKFFTGLDPVPGGLATGGARPAVGSQPELPQAANGKLSLDAEGLVRLNDGGWLISDEYGPSIYRFDADGKFISALPVPAALRPVRNSTSDYSSNNPGTGQPAPVPANPTAGRQNNQGLEGISLAPDGKTLIAVLQSSTRQDLNTADTASTRRNTRVVTYDISDIDNPVITGEYALQLPTYLAGSNTRVAAQSEIYALSATRFLILPRDGNGFSTANATSLYRQVDIVDLEGATNISGRMQIAPGGVLDPTITPATLKAWLNINDNSELNRFGLRNGGVNDRDNLSEKWEGLSLLSVLDASAPDDYFLFVSNDNDFLTTTGFQVGLPYAASVDNDTTFLVYRVTLPGLRAAVSEPGTLALAGLGLMAMGLVRGRKRSARQ